MLYPLSYEGDLVERAGLLAVLPAYCTMQRAFLQSVRQCGDNTGRLPLIQGINETEIIRILGLPLLDRIIFPSLE